MSEPFRPMLAAEADLSKLRFPLIASPKLDGIRALVKGGVVLSRSLKPIPNKHVQKLFGRPELEGLDGELIVGSPTDKDCFLNTSGAVRRAEGEPDVKFYVFDRWNRTGPYDAAFCTDLEFQASGAPFVIPVGCSHVCDMEALLGNEEELLEAGYEGVILRDPSGPYKFGRSTAKEGYLLKLKRFKDSEARILAVEELMHNANEAKTNELGRTERSSHKANQVPMGALGALFVEDIHTGQRFRIGTGFTQEDRDHFWELRDSVTDSALWKEGGLIVKYRFFPVGVKDLPRHPSYIGLRDTFDL